MASDKMPVMAGGMDPNTTAILQWLMGQNMPGLAGMMPMMTSPQQFNTAGMNPQLDSLGSTGATNYYQDLLQLNTDPMAAMYGGTNAYSPDAFNPTTTSAVVATPGRQLLTGYSANPNSLDGWIAAALLDPVSPMTPSQIRSMIEDLATQDPATLTPEETMIVSQIPMHPLDKLAGEDAVPEINIDAVEEKAQGFVDLLMNDPQPGPGSREGTMLEWDPATGQLIETSSTPSAAGQAFADAGLSLPTQEFTPEFMLGDDFAQRQQAYLDYLSSTEDEYSNPYAYRRAEAAATRQQQQAAAAAAPPAVEDVESERGDENGMGIGQTGAGAVGSQLNTLMSVSPATAPIARMYQSLAMLGHGGPTAADTAGLASGLPAPIGPLVSGTTDFINRLGGNGPSMPQSAAEAGAGMPGVGGAVSLGNSAYDWLTNEGAGSLGRWLFGGNDDEEALPAGGGAGVGIHGTTLNPRAAAAMAMQRAMQGDDGAPPNASPPLPVEPPTTTTVPQQSPTTTTTTVPQQPGGAPMQSQLMQAMLAMILPQNGQQSTSQAPLGDSAIPPSQVTVNASPPLPQTTQPTAPPAVLSQIAPPSTGTTLPPGVTAPQPATSAPQQGPTSTPRPAFTTADLNFLVNSAGGGGNAGGGGGNTGGTPGLGEWSNNGQMPWWLTGEQPGSSGGTPGLGEWSNNGQVPWWLTGEQPGGASTPASDPLRLSSLQDLLRFQGADANVANSHTMWEAMMRSLGLGGDGRQTPTSPPQSEQRGRGTQVRPQTPTSPPQSEQEGRGTQVRKPSTAFDIPVIGGHRRSASERTNAAREYTYDRRNAIASERGRAAEATYDYDFGYALGLSKVLRKLGVRPLDLELAARNQPLASAGIRPA